VEKAVAEEVVIHLAQAELSGVAADLAAAPVDLEAVVSAALEAVAVSAPAGVAPAGVGKQLLNRHGIFRKILELITFTN
jgi:hypothetical protein